MFNKSFEIKQLDAFKAAGINRISLGIQSLHDRHLTFMGRDHTAKEAFGAIESTMSLFGNVSLDFIWGLPDQSLEEWSNDLEVCLLLY